MPFTTDLDKPEVTELRNAIIDGLTESVKTLKKGKPTDDDRLVLQEIQADAIRIIELMDGRVSNDTLNLYQVKMKEQ